MPVVIEPGFGIVVLPRKSDVKPTEIVKCDGPIESGIRRPPNRLCGRVRHQLRPSQMVRVHRIEGTAANHPHELARQPDVIRWR